MTTPGDAPVGTGTAGAAPGGAATTAGPASWPARRLVATLVASPVLLVLLSAIGGGWSPGAAPVWTVLVAVTAVVTAATLASYVPLRGAGWRPDTGCTQCARVAGFSVPAAGFMLGMSPHDLPFAALALGVAGFGLVQRLTGGGACAVPAGVRR